VGEILFEQCYFKKIFNVEKKMVKSLAYLLSIFFISVFFQLVLWRTGLFMGLTLLLILFIILMPLASFFYSKSFIARNNKKWLKSVICPIVLAISYLVLYFREDETYVFALILFVWCEIWSLIGLRGLKSSK
jgi:glucan phosphoethanolaminetransferase (alkaline phosphatase superfamily)